MTTPTPTTTTTTTNNKSGGGKDESSSLRISRISAPPLPVATQNRLRALTSAAPSSSVLAFDRRPIHATEGLTFSETEEGSRSASTHHHYPHHANNKPQQQPHLRPADAKSAVKVSPPHQSLMHTFGECAVLIFFPRCLRSLSLSLVLLFLSSSFQYVHGYEFSLSLSAFFCLSVMLSVCHVRVRSLFHSLCVSCYLLIFLCLSIQMCGTILVLGVL